VRRNLYLNESLTR